MLIVQDFLTRRKIVFEKLVPYGFIKQGSNYEYSTPIVDGEFRMQVLISENGRIETKVIDASTNEEFVLHLVPEASGSFVGQVKEEYEEVLTSIQEYCTEKEVFKSETAKQVIAYVRDKYGDELEYLWKKFPDNAIWRRKDTNKWYAALLRISRRKLGVDSDEVVDVIDLRIEPAKIETLIDGIKYFPGYHMNKKNWYTICLDGSVSGNEICRRIDTSYRLAKK